MNFKMLKNKTLNSALWYTLSNIIAKGISLLLTPVFTRILTKGQYGIYTNFVSWQNILVTVFSLELSSTILRARFDYKDDAEFSGYVYTIALFGMLFSCSLIGAISALLKFDLKTVLGIDNKFAFMLCCIIVFSPLLQLFQAEQRAEIKYKLSSLITLLYGISTFGFPFLIMSIKDDKLYSLFLGMTINAVFWGGAIFGYYFRCKKSKVKKEYIFYGLNIALPIVPHLISNIIMGNSDKLMISYYCGADFTAMYGVVYTCALAITLLRNSLNSAWVPWFYEKMESKDYEKILTISKIFLEIFSVGSILMCLLGPEIVMFLGGSQYREAVYLMPIIMLGCYYNFVYLFYVNIEFYEKKTIMISVITIITAVLNIFLNSMFIIRFGYSAAAYTTAFCNFIIVVFHYFVTKKMGNYKVCNNRQIFSFCALACVAAIICIISYKFSILRYILFALMILMSVRIITKDDIKKLF